MIRVEGRSIAGAFGACHPIMFMASVGALSALAATSDVPEHQLKAAAVYNLIAFTEWPPTAFQTADAPFVIGVFGRGPVAALLEYRLASETWHGRKITLRQITAAGDARFCHVIYIAPSEITAWRIAAGKLARTPLLTLSDAQNFARDGGIAELAFENNELRLVVNMGAARECGLTISSKVLRRARIVDGLKP